MDSLSLEKFIYKVKRELLDAQEKHEGDPVYLELQKVDIEVSIAVKRTAKGAVNVYVAELGSDIAKEFMHRVTLGFEVVPFDLLPPSGSRGGKGGARKSVQKGVRPGGVAYRPSSPK